MKARKTTAKTLNDQCTKQDRDQSKKIKIELNNVGAMHALHRIRQPA